MYHFYPEFEKDGEFSPSSFVSGIRDRLQNFFQSKEKKRAGARVEGFHTAKKKDWDQFLNHASRKSFVKQLGSDSRSDAKLVMHADNMNRLQTGKKVGTIQGGSKSYSIVKLRGKDRLGCTCNDWRYKRSVAKPGEVVDCKHVRQFKQMNKTAAYEMQKVSGKRTDEVLAALRSLARDPIHKEHVDSWSRHAALNAGQASDSLSRGEIRDAAKESIFAVLPPTHHSPEEMKGMMRTRSGKRTRHRDWYRWGRGDDIPEPSKTASAYEEGGSFTHDGQKYSLREAFRAARTKPTKQIDVDKLKWILRHDRPDPKRLAAANLAAPVIVAPDRRGRPTVVDGLHRLSKAVQQGKKTMPAKMLTLSDLKKEASDKAPRLTFITGGAGAGKSTMAKKLVDSGEFDVLIGTDTGGVVNGQYVKPPKAEREKIRNRREALALKMRAKGKRVLVEGYPRGALRYPKLLAQADDVLYLDTPMATRMFRVGKRSRERGTPMLPDLKMGLTTHFDDLKYRKEIEKKSPNFRSIRTYEDIKKEAMAAREASSKGMQVGDVILTAMAPEQYSKDSGAPLHKRMKEQFFRKASPAAQGSYTHSAIYVGKGQVVEALQGGVVRRSLKRSLRDLDGAVVVRPKVSTKARRAAAAFAKTQVGAPYESHKFLAKKGFSIFMPKYFDKKLDHGKELKKTDKWTCSNLIGAAYALQGHATHTRGGRWSMTAPADFLVSDRNAHVKHLGKALGQRPTIGRLKGKTDLADVSEASAKSRTYKDAKKEAMVLWGLDA